MIITFLYHMHHEHDLTYRVGYHKLNLLFLHRVVGTPLLGGHYAACYATLAYEASYIPPFPTLAFLGSFDAVS